MLGILDNTFTFDINNILIQSIQQQLWRPTVTRPRAPLRTNADVQERTFPVDKLKWTHQRLWWYLSMTLLKKQNTMWLMRLA